MILNLYLLFLFASFFVLFPSKIKYITYFFYAILGALLIYVAGWREPDVTNDYRIYLGYWYVKKFTDVEISFQWIKLILKDTLDLKPLAMFITYAVLGVGIKMLAIQKMSTNIFLSIIVYLSSYYILHELTQIRVGVAAGFFLMSLVFNSQRKFLPYILMVGLAVFFHYSALLIIPLWFVSNTKRGFHWYLMLIPVSFVLYFLGTKFMVNLPIGYLQDRLETYQTDAKNTKINVFNAVFILKVVVFYLIALRIKTISQHSNYAYLVTKIYGISLFCFPAFAAIPVLSFRIQELYGCVDVILFPLLVYLFKERILGYIMVFAIGLTLISLSIFYNNLVFY